MYICYRVIQGRVGIEYLDTSEASRGRQYAFKCHRRAEMVFPVTALAYHPLYGSLASGGCDGGVCIWDWEQKKRLAQLPPYPAAVAAVAFK